MLLRMRMRLRTGKNFISFWLSYRIGNLRAAVKKVKRGIENDDVLKE